jgi:hypothetical protein
MSEMFYPLQSILWYASQDQLLMWLYSGDQSSDAWGSPQTLMPLDFHGSFALERLLQAREVSQHSSVSSCTVTLLGQDVREFAPVLRYY